MEDCKICYETVSNKKLPCGHELCSKCCVKLNSPLCPFCRQNFTYTADEIKERIKLNIVNGYLWEVPPGLVPWNERLLPRDWIQNSNNQNNEDVEMINEPFSRVRKNMERRRRRFLSFDEVLERRQLIRERKARHWDKKNAQLSKRNHMWNEI